MKVKVGVSNRHVHLTRQTLDILYGKDYELTIKNNLTQKDQFAANEVVTIMTNKDKIEKVRIIGPVRDYNQIEISKTDAYKLGINPPIRRSGDIQNSEVVTIIGPMGKIITSGCIIAERHIHISESDMVKYGFISDKVSVQINGPKGAILNNVRLKIDNSTDMEMHIDTDDANANFVKQGDIVTLIK